MGKALAEDPDLALMPSPLVFMMRRRFRTASQATQADARAFRKRSLVSFAFIGLIVRVVLTAYELNWARSKRSDSQFRDRPWWLPAIVGFLSDFFFMYVVCRDIHFLSIFSLSFFLVFAAANIFFKFYPLAALPALQALGLFLLVSPMKPSSPIKIQDSSV